MKKFDLNLKVLFLSSFLLSGSGLFAQPTMTFNGGGITQPGSSGTGDPYPSEINVSGIEYGFLKVTVTLTGLSHTSSNDLNILLVGPQGQQCVLMSDVGSSDELVDVEYVFDDDGPAMTTSGANPSGTYAPTNNGPTDNWPSPGPGSVTQPGPALSIFNGTDADGAWSLYYNDDASGDSGSLDSWSITFTLPATVVNDECEYALTISCGETVSGATADALPDDVRSCAPGDAGSGVWYTFNPSGGGFIQSLSTCNTDNTNIRISIYYNHCNNLRCLGASNDPDACGNNNTEVLFTPFFGRTHYVLIQPVVPGEEVDFELTYNCDAGAARPLGATVISAEDAESISLYPNPVQDELNVALEGFAGRQVTMRIHNSLGQVVMQRNISRLEEQAERFNTSQLQSGMYYLNVQVEGGATFTEKFLIGHTRP